MPAAERKSLAILGGGCAGMSLARLAGRDDLDIAVIDLLTRKTELIIHVASGPLKIQQAHGTQDMATLADHHR